MEKIMDKKYKIRAVTVNDIDSIVSIYNSTEKIKCYSNDKRIIANDCRE